jgi:predicted Rossmann fold nucleotide-binding protein DprA/Smf involved in DNA uptake
MQRNRILLALCRAIVLVEPGLKGGTGGTGAMARKLGISRFLLYSDEAFSAAERRFIESGARPISADGITPRELTRIFQRSWEESEIIRYLGKPHDLFE